MELEAPKYEDPVTGQKYELLSLQEFKERIHQPDLSTPTLNYKMETDQLDYVKLGTFRYIVFNEKAQAMRVLNRRPRKKK